MSWRQGASSASSSARSWQRCSSEQDLAASGRVSKSTGAKIGKLTGARYLVFATVTAFDSHTAGTGGGLSFHGIGVGGKKEDAYIAVDLRVVDTTTGEVEFTRTVEGRATSYGMGGSVYRGGFGGQLGKYENTPTGKAIRGCIIEITDYLGCAMVDKDSCLDEYAAKETVAPRQDQEDDQTRLAPQKALGLGF